MVGTTLYVKARMYNKKSNLYIEILMQISSRSFLSRGTPMNLNLKTGRGYGTSSSGIILPSVFWGISCFLHGFFAEVSGINGWNSEKYCFLSFEGCVKLKYLL